MSNQNSTCTIDDIAREAGVAASTVSRVLNNSASNIPIAEKTRNKVMEIARKLNYSPNVNAKRLAKGRTNTIALIVPAHKTESENIFADFTLMKTLQGIESVLLEIDFRLLMVFKDERFIKRDDHLRLFKEKSIDGMLIWGAQLQETFYKGLQGQPVVFMVSRPPDDCFSFVGHENSKGSYSLTEHLIKAGRKRIHYLAGPLNVSISRERLDGFLEAMKTHSLSDHASVYEMNAFYIEDGYVAALELIKSGRIKSLDAIMCVNDDSARGVIKACFEHGVKTPEQIVVGGGDSIHDLNPTTPHLSFKVDSYGVGRQAAKLLYDIMEKREGGSVNLLLPVAPVIF